MPIENMEFLIAAISLGYLSGSIPFGLVLTKLAGHGDIRRIGSGNIGATNVLRTGNKWLALATLLLDGGKGAFAIFIIRINIPIPLEKIECLSEPCSYGIDYTSEIIAACGLAAILGHLFPVWLKFKGGKGVATTLGVLLAATPFVGLAACVIWLLMAVTFRYSSLAALVAVIATPPLAYTFYGNSTLTALCGIIALLVWFKHRANIQRLVAGEEPKIGKGK